jgi:hypothetical protein
MRETELHIAQVASELGRRGHEGAVESVMCETELDVA